MENINTEIREYFKNSHMLDYDIIVSAILEPHLIIKKYGRTQYFLIAQKWACKFIEYGTSKEHLIEFIQKTVSNNETEFVKDFQKSPYYYFSILRAKLRENQLHYRKVLYLIEMTFYKWDDGTKKLYEDNKELYKLSKKWRKIYKKASCDTEDGLKYEHWFHSIKFCKTIGIKLHEDFIKYPIAQFIPEKIELKISEYLSRFNLYFKKIYAAISDPNSILDLKGAYPIAKKYHGIYEFWEGHFLSLLEFLEARCYSKKEFISSFKDDQYYLLETNK